MPKTNSVPGVCNAMQSESLIILVQHPKSQVHDSNKENAERLEPIMAPMCLCNVLPTNHEYIQECNKAFVDTSNSADAEELTYVMMPEGITL